MSVDRAQLAGGQTRGAELGAKLTILRTAIERHGMGGVRLRGQDWFAWATCGGSSAVLLASERGIAEVLVTMDGAWVLTDAIEEERLRAEEVPPELPVLAFPWADRAAREAFVREALRGEATSDVPLPGERPLPDDLAMARTRLLPAEVERYRSLGREAAEAMTRTLDVATPRLRELELAGIGAEQLLACGIEPALILVAGFRRMHRYRHPRPTAETIGDAAMVVFCGRRAGLYANLTRAVSFGRLSDEDRRRARAVALVEAAAFQASRPGATLGKVFAAMVDAYARHGFPGAELRHHQGGTTGYRSRERVATPDDTTEIGPMTALAWNPSLPGSKIEDTVLCTDEGLEILTVDPAWPMEDVEGRLRPLVRAAS